MANNRTFGKWQQYRDHGLKNIRGMVVRKESDPKTLGYVKFQKGDSERSREKFISEVEALEGLGHPNIVKLLDYDSEAERPYMVTELCKGGTLKSTNLSEWTVEEKRICFRQICEAFAYLWDKGITKGDHNFKNIFLKEGNTPVIGDFEYASSINRDAEGVAKILHTAGYCFWEIMEEKKFNSVLARERRINKQIEELSEQLEELQQQKAELLS